MKAHQSAANPFVLMMDPEAVLRAVERSERLQHLSRHVYRPLDKPMIPHVLSDLEAFDQSVDEGDDCLPGADTVMSALI
jgi:hypothetical protein